jgi:hypothetical protein
MTAKHNFTETITLGMGPMDVTVTKEVSDTEDFNLKFEFMPDAENFGAISVELQGVSNKEIRKLAEVLRSIAGE